MNHLTLRTIVSLSLGSFVMAGCLGDDDAGSAASASGTEGSTDSAGTDSASGETVDPTQGSASMSGGTDSAGTDSASDSATATASDTAGTDSASETVTDSAGTDSAGTDSAGTDSAGTDSAGTDSAGSDGSTGDDTQGNTGVDPLCEAPGEIMPCDEGTDDPFHAIGLNCPYDQNSAIPIVNEGFYSADPAAWRIATQLGTHVDPVTMEPFWGPREGSSFLMISTGTINAPDVDGVITMTSADTSSGNANPDGVQLPAPMSPLPGSNGGAGGTPFVNCDAVNDCSDSLQEQWNLGGGSARDLLWFQFETQVPGGTFGYSFDFAYFSQEFPEYVGTTFNDIFMAWSASETYTGNLCFVNDQPCTVTALEMQVQYGGNDPELAGTGFDGAYGTTPISQATGWFTAQGTAAPGEMLQLTFAVFDMGDTILDTAVILDNFAWDCEGCVPSEVDPCIGIDPV